MKRLYLFVLSVCLCITSVHSQLQVDSAGYVGVGITNAVIAYEGDSIIHSPFAVCTVGVPYAIANFQSSDRQYTLTAYTERANQQGDGTAIWGVSYTHNGNSEGVVGVGMSSNINNNTIYNIGVRGEVTGGYNAIGVYGGKYTSHSYTNYAGIYGTTNSSGPTFQYPGTYAGYFVGIVRATGPMYAPAFYTPSANPSKGGNDESTFVSLIEEESVTDKLRNISSFEFQHNEQKMKEEAPSPVDDFLQGRKIQQLSKKELHQLDSICMNTVSPETDPLSSVNYGLDAAQLKAVFPKLVQQDKEGNYSINYVEMVPLLVKGINEMSEKIEKLEQQLKVQKQTKKVKSTTGLEETMSDVDIVRMDQNNPNPFSESTVIGLNIPEKTQKANVFIYDLSGKQIQSVPVTERGETNITVYAGNLNAGMYIYSLVVDGKVAVTRRMIVSE